MNAGRVSLFALGASRAFGAEVARAMRLPLSAHEEREFEDGEHKSRPLESVRDRDAYVIESLYGEEAAGRGVDEKLCRLLFFIATLKDAGAARVTAVVPYLCYARKDRRTQPRDPVTGRYVAQLFEAVGTDRVVTMGVHNPAAYQSGFRCQTVLLEAQPLLVDYFASLLRDRSAAVVSPDFGGLKRAVRFREALERALGRPLAQAVMEKRRAGGVVSGDTLYGEVRGRTVVIVDDLISTGGTLARTASACLESGAERAYAAATHGVFTGEAATVLEQAPIDEVVVTDCVPPSRLPPDLVASRITLLRTAPLFADAIRRLAGNTTLN